MGKAAQAYARQKIRQRHSEGDSAGGQLAALYARHGTATRVVLFGIAAAAVCYLIGRGPVEEAPLGGVGSPLTAKADRISKSGRPVWDGGSDRCITCLTPELVKAQHKWELAMVAKKGADAPELRFSWYHGPDKQLGGTVESMSKKVLQRAARAVGGPANQLPPHAPPLKFVRC